MSEIEVMIQSMIAKAIETALEDIKPGPSERWPEVLTPKLIAKHTGISESRAREWFHIDGFPKIKDTGVRQLVGKYALWKWMNNTDFDEVRKGDPCINNMLYGR